MWKKHPVEVADKASAIVLQNHYGILIDLHLASRAMLNNALEPQYSANKPFYDTQKYRYMVWSDIAFRLIAVVKERDDKLWLTWFQPWTETEVALENVIEVAVTKWGKSGIWQCLD